MRARSALARRRRFARSGPIGRSTRIGISREIERKLRFFERDNAFVSGPRRLRS